MLLTCTVSAVWILRRRHIPDAQRAFFLVLLLAFVVENTSAILVLFDLRNNWLYNLYIPLEFYLLAYTAHRSLVRRWSTALALIVGLVFTLVFAWEMLRPGTFNLLNAHSTMLGWALLTFLYATLLVLLAESCTKVLWKEQRFWVYFSVLLFMGPAIPYVGMLNMVHARDAELARHLFVILDILFFLRYSAALLGGSLLRTQRVPRC